MTCEPSSPLRVRRRSPAPLAALAALWASSLACAPGMLRSTAPWLPLAELNAGLPDSVRVWKLEDARLRAWCVRADLSDPAVRARLVVADDEDRRETVSSLGEQVGAAVVVNAGFFRRTGPVARHTGLLRVDGEWIEAEKEIGPALGFDAEGRADVAWIRGGAEGVVELPFRAGSGPGGRVRAPVPVDDPPPWPMPSLLVARPALIFEGVPYVHGDDVRHPRTAVGLTAERDLVLLVVDGRQRASRGATLDELAAMLLDLGCVEAVNLDGGGSTALVVGGRLVNRPEGGTEQREVMSALALVLEPPGPD